MDSSHGLVWKSVHISDTLGPLLLNHGSREQGSLQSQKPECNAFCNLVQLVQFSCNSVQFSSVTQSGPNLCNPMECSTPVFPVHHQLPELVQTHVHQVGDNHPSISSSVILFSSCLQSLPALGSFQMSQFFASGGQSIGVSASTSVLPMNIQD